MKTETLTERTKGEWYVDKDLSEDEFAPYLKIMSTIAGRTLIADVSNFKYLNAPLEEAEANAAFICKAVNNYDMLERANWELDAAVTSLHKENEKLKAINDSLLSALKEAYSLLNGGGEDYRDEILYNIKEAIKKAQQ